MIERRHVMQENNSLQPQINLAQFKYPQEITEVSTTAFTRHVIDKRKHHNSRQVIMEQRTRIDELKAILVEMKHNACTECAKKLRESYSIQDVVDAAYEIVKLECTNGMCKI